MLLKLPTVVADLVLSVLAYRIVRTCGGERRATIAAGIAAVLPSTWALSSVWGQVDSICCAFMLLALALLIDRRFVLAWVALTNAVLIKPLPIAPAVANGRDVARRARSCRRGAGIRALAGIRCIGAGSSGSIDIHVAAPRWPSREVSFTHT
jgi:hypothetical protein